jgi:hypothetical protein
MISLERELTAARDAGLLSSESHARVAAIERGELFSIHHELRLIVYGAIVLIVTGVGMLIADNLDQLGPLAIIGGLLAASAALYGWCTFKMRRKGELSIFDAYLALLAALLLSSAIGYAESQYHLLGDDWSLHLLLLSIVHAASAYFFKSRLLLSLSLTTLAAWFGIERRFDTIVNSGAYLARQAILCASVILVWREAHRRMSKQEEMLSAFDHFALNLGFVAALLLIGEREGWEPLGLLLLAGSAVVALLLAKRRGSDLFLIYAIVYSLIGLSMSVVERLDDEALIALYFIFAIGASVVLFFVLRIRWEREA